ncbi:MAG: hypothetical protein K0S07_1130 [Chlamydiales bacterium]|jgi:hypothetical protein|nr:hypothetical protein [Chlamydiales bacterium]
MQEVGFKIEEEASLTLSLRGMNYKSPCYELFCNWQTIHGGKADEGWAVFSVDELTLLSCTSKEVEGDAECSLGILKVKEPADRQGFWSLFKRWHALLHGNPCQVIDKTCVEFPLEGVKFPNLCPITLQPATTFLPLSFPSLFRRRSLKWPVSQEGLARYQREVQISSYRLLALTLLQIPISYLAFFKDMGFYYEIFSVSFIALTLFSYLVELAPRGIRLRSHRQGRGHVILKESDYLLAFLEANRQHKD